MPTRQRLPGQLLRSRPKNSVILLKGILSRLSLRSFGRIRVSGLGKVEGNVPSRHARTVLGAARFLHGRRTGNHGDFWHAPGD